MIEMKIFYNAYLPKLQSWLGFGKNAPEPEQSGPSTNINSPDPLPRKWADAWHIMDLLLQEYQRIALQANAMPLLMPVSMQEEVHPLPKERINSVANQRLKGMARNIELKFVDLIGSLAPEAERTGTLFHHFNHRIEGAHYNAAGHAAVAKFLGNAICQALKKQ